MLTSVSEEIRVGPMAIRFLLEGEASRGSVAVFEFDVPAGARLPAAHSHDGYEETMYGLEGVLAWTLEGRQIDVGPGEVLCIPRGVVHRFETRTRRTPRYSRSSLPGFSGQTISARWRRSSTLRPAARPISRRSGQ